MAESNEQPPLCPCGFWGSPYTSGLCSVCFKSKAQGIQQQAKEHDTNTTVFVPGSSSSVAAAADGAAPPVCPLAVTVFPPTATDVPSLSFVPDATTASENMPVDIASIREAASGADSDSSATACSGSRDGSPSRPVQKNKKRCFTCKARLELAFVEIGRCKCGYTFCEMHRLPEQHTCTYDHKERGRQEAREKMISPKKHVGTTLRRLDSDT